MNWRVYVIGSFVICLLSLSMAVQPQGPVEAALLLQPATMAATPSLQTAPSLTPAPNTPVPPTAAPPPSATVAPPAATAVAPTATPAGKPSDPGSNPAPTSTPAIDSKGATPVTTLTVMTPAATAGPTFTPYATPTFVPSSADLAVAMHASSHSGRVGQIITFFINVVNQGGASTLPTRLVLTIPGGAVPISFGPDCGLGPIAGLHACTSSGAACTTPSFGGTISCSVPALAPGATSTTTVSLQVVAPSGAIYAMVQVDPDRIVSDHDLSDNTASVSVWIVGGSNEPTVADLTLRAAVSPNPVRPGEVLSYFVTVINDGRVTTPPTRLVMPVPFGTNPISPEPGCSPSEGASCSATGIGGACKLTQYGEVECPVPTLSPGAAITYVLAFQVWAADGTIFADLQVDPGRRILERDEVDNRTVLAVEIISAPPNLPWPAGPPPLPASVQPLPVPRPAALPAPLAPTAASPATPAPTAQTWLQVLEPTMAYSPNLEPLWTAQVGEWYRVVLQEGEWALVVWEYDEPEQQEWIHLDGRIALTQDDLPSRSALFLLIHEPTPVYSPTMDLLWDAEAGERYRIQEQSGGWLLVIWEHDPPDWQTWIQVDLRVEVVRLLSGV